MQFILVYMFVCAFLWNRNYFWTSSETGILSIIVKRISKSIVAQLSIRWTHRCSMEGPKKLKTPNKFRTLLALIDLKVAKEGVQPQQQMQKQQQQQQ